jgi:hypothetical protein
MAKTKKSMMLLVTLLYLSDMDFASLLSVERYCYKVAVFLCFASAIEVKIPLGCLHTKSSVLLMSICLLSTNSGWEEAKFCFHQHALHK